MNQNYVEVPNILSGKDLDYVSDMFQWNYNVLKQVNNYINNVQNEEVKEILLEGFELFKNNLNEVLKILKEENCG